MKASVSLLAAALAAGLTTPDVAAQTFPRYHQASASIPDSFHSGALAPHVIWIEGVKYDFVAGGQLMETDTPGGLAHLTGLIAETGNPGAKFVLDFELSGFVDAASAPPAGSPKRGLMPSAYVEGGGPIDTSTWEYYTSITVTMTGVDDYAGALITGTRRGEAFQIGLGAANKNATEYGASAWFTSTVVTQPTSGVVLTGGDSDLNIDLDIGCECAHPFGPNGHALWMFGIGSNEFVFKNGAGMFLERDDGTATLVGSLVDRFDSSIGFDIDVELDTRVCPGEASYPPVGSPKRELPSSLYVGLGGSPIDEADWHYYEGMSGTLIGTGGFAGAIADITRRGPAFQLGFGADGTGLQWGGSGWINFTFTAQPTSGPALGSSGGDIRIATTRCVPAEPCLAPGAAKQSLPVITQDAFEFDACAPLEVDYVMFGSTMITSQDPKNWDQGYFELIDCERLRVHPPICLPEGDYDLTAGNAVGLGNTIEVALTRPTSPTIGTHEELMAGDRQTVFVHPGPPRNMWAPILLLSGSPQPSVLPGTVTLGLGAAWSQIAFCTMWRYDPIADCALFGPYPIPRGVTGITLYFQALVLLDPTTQPLPIEATNVVSTDYP